MTAYVMDSRKRKMQKRPEWMDYLAKPLDETELKKVLKKYLDKFVKRQNDEQINT